MTRPDRKAARDPDRRLVGLSCPHCGSLYSHSCPGPIVIPTSRPPAPLKWGRWLRIPRFPYGYNLKYILWRARARGMVWYRTKGARFQFADEYGRAFNANGHPARDA